VRLSHQTQTVVPAPANNQNSVNQSLIPNWPMAMEILRVTHQNWQMAAKFLRWSAIRQNWSLGQKLPNWPHRLWPMDLKRRLLWQLQWRHLQEAVFKKILKQVLPTSHCLPRVIKLRTNKKDIGLPLILTGCEEVWVTSNPYWMWGGLGHL